jgi:putative transposase
MFKGVPDASYAMLHHTQREDVSIRRACRVFLVDTFTYHYKSRRPGQAALEQRIKDICQTRVRYGYRRVHVLLRREGWSLGQNMTRRIYRELGLN